MSIGDVEILRAACCVAGLDKKVTPEEIKLLQRLVDKAGVGAASFNAMLERAKTDANYFQDQFRLVRADPKEAMHTLAGVAVSDGVLSPDERVVLQHLANRLGVTQADFDKLMRAAEKYVATRSGGAKNAGSP